jgi:soluble lytic murein transglycosylase
LARIRKRRRRRFFPLVFPALLLAVLAAAGITAASSLLKKAEDNYYNSAYPLKYSELVTEYCKDYQVDEALVYAVIKNESGFQPDAVSNVDARGLMQIQGPTLEWAVYREKEDAQVTADDLFDPEVNVKYGVYLLSLFLDEFKTPDVALCAYHAGWGNVKKWLQDPDYSSDGESLQVIPFGDTNAYVSRVLETRDIYQELYELPTY